MTVDQGVPVGNLELLIESSERLHAERPDLAPDLPTFAAAVDELMQAHRYYCTNVSTGGHAVSLRTAAYLLCACRTLRPAKVLDLGSGFSSFVFAKYASTAGEFVDIVSVDTDAEWLAKTSDFLALSNLSGVVWLTLLDDLGPGEYDLVFHDLAGGDIRSEMMPTVCDSVAPGGVAVFDDMHHLGHFDAMREATEAWGMPWASLHQWTLDSALRFAVVATKGTP